jgi:hypothetical protein
MQRFLSTSWHAPSGWEGRADTEADRAKLSHARSAQLHCVALGVCLCMAIAACGPAGPRVAPLAPATLTAEQTTALQRLNEAGKVTFEGRTWRYEFGAGCLLRVQRSFEGRHDGLKDIPMAGRRVEVVNYIEGFGVKAYARGMGGSEDLFDSMSPERAQAFAGTATELVAGCPAKS